MVLNGSHVIIILLLSGHLGFSSTNFPKLSQDGQSSEEEDDDHSDYEGGHDQNYEDISVDPKDEEAFAAFMNPERGVRKTLADLVIPLSVSRSRTLLSKSFSNLINLKL
jgi:hypothetical protein